MEPQQPTADQWFYVRGKKVVGPHTAQQMVNLAATTDLIQPETQVRNGAYDWLPASQAPGMLSPREPGPPARGMAIPADIRPTVKKGGVSATSSYQMLIVFALLAAGGAGLGIGNSNVITSLPAIGFLLVAIGLAMLDRLRQIQAVLEAK